MILPAMVLPPICGILPIPGFWRGDGGGGEGFPQVFRNLPGWTGEAIVQWRQLYLTPVGLQRLADHGGLPGPEDVPRPVTHVGALVVRVFRVVGLLDAGPILVHEDLLVVRDELRTGVRDLMADRLRARPEEEVDDVDTITIRRILFRDGDADAQPGHLSEKKFIVRFPGLGMHMRPHGISTEYNLVAMGAEPFAES